MLKVIDKFKYIVEVIIALDFLLGIIIGIIKLFAGEKISAIFFLIILGILGLTIIILSIFQDLILRRLNLYEKIAEERPSLLMTIRMLLNQKSKKQMNNCVINEATLEVRVPNQNNTSIKGNVHDLKFSWILNGENVHKENLSTIFFRIAGDNIVELSDINFCATQTDINNDSKHPIDYDKINVEKKFNYYVLPLFLPISVPSKKNFSISVSYVWPKCFNSYVDYLIIDPLNFSSIPLKHARINIIADNTIIKNSSVVKIFQINRKPSKKDYIKHCETLNYCEKIIDNTKVNLFQSSYFDCDKDKIYFVEIMNQ